MQASHRQPWATEADMQYLTDVAQRIFQGEIPPANMRAPSGWYVFVNLVGNLWKPYALYFCSAGGSTAVRFDWHTSPYHKAA